MSSKRQRTQSLTLVNTTFQLNRHFFRDPTIEGPQTNRYTPQFSLHVRTHRHTCAWAHKNRWHPGTRECTPTYAQTYTIEQEASTQEFDYRLTGCILSVLCKKDKNLVLNWATPASILLHLWTKYCLDIQIIWDICFFNLRELPASHLEVFNFFDIE